jgi:hypothetical protein
MAAHLEMDRFTAASHRLHFSRAFAGYSIGLARADTETRELVAGFHALEISMVDNDLDRTGIREVVDLGQAGLGLHLGHLEWTSIPAALKPIATGDGIANSQLSLWCHIAGGLNTSRSGGTRIRPCFKMSTTVRFRSRVRKFRRPFPDWVS